MNRILRIFVACFSGAGLGATIALQLNQYLWWLGMLIGGIIGYLSYNFKAVILALPNAYKKARSGISKERDGIIGLIYFILWSASWYMSMVGIYSLKLFLPMSTVSLLIFVNLFSMLISLTFATNVELPKIKPEPKHAGGKYVILISNPISFYFYLLPKVIFFSLRGLLKALCFTGRFIWQLFILIHSELRLLCGVDAAIGAGIGYFAGNAIIGALVGGVFGIINYKIVSQKMLKLHLKNSV